MLDVASVERATGWRVHHRVESGSTNDDALALRAEGAAPRAVVVADRQREGRGREGRAFASPDGGLYVSMILSVGPLDLPGPLVAATALAVAEALECVTGLTLAIKWPNDLWLRGLKVGGILLEAAAGGPGSVVVGVGLNVVEVPTGLTAPVRAGVTALAVEAGRPVPREGLLIALLERVDRRLSDLKTPTSRAALGELWRGRLALKGARVTWREGLKGHAGLFLDASIEEGLTVVDDAHGARLLRSEFVSELRPA